MLRDKGVLLAVCEHSFLEYECLGIKGEKLGIVEGKGEA